MDTLRGVVERLTKRLRIPAYVLGAVAIVLAFANLALPVDSVTFKQRGWLVLGLMWSGGLWLLWRLHYPSRVVTRNGEEQLISPWKRSSSWMRAYVYLIMAIWFPALIVFTVFFARMNGS